MKERVARRGVCQRQAPVAKAGGSQSQRRAKGTRSNYCSIAIPVLQKSEWNPRGGAEERGQWSKSLRPRAEEAWEARRPS